MLQTITHTSTAYIHQWTGGNYTKNEGDSISKQARFVLRMAVACHEAGIPYEMEWNINGSAKATILVCGPNIPMPKPFPKAPAVKRVSQTWKPSPYEAEYRLEAAWDRSVNKRAPGFVIAHSCGLSLVKAGESDSGIIGSDSAEDAVTDHWWLVHTKSGKGFGVDFKFSQAVKALLLIADAIDWTRPFEEFPKRVFQTAAWTVLATFGNSHQKNHGKRELERLAEVQ